MAEVVVFGNQNMAEAAAFHLVAAGHSLAAFTVDRTYVNEETFCGLPVVPFEDVSSVYPPTQFKMWLPLGFRNVNKFRAQKYYEAKAKGYELVSNVSRGAVIWPSVEIGDNAFICEGVIIQPRARIGNNVVIASGSVIGHHTVIKDHCFVAAHTTILGCVTIESYCFLGVNSSVREGVTIATECIIGAGVYVGANTTEKGVYVGKPPELLRKPSNELGAWLTWPGR